MADKNVLLVEGKDDDSVFYHLSNHHQIQGGFRIKKKNGINQLVDELDVELDASGLERLGVVVDADVDLTARWQAQAAVLRVQQSTQKTAARRHYY